MLPGRSGREDRAPPGALRSPDVMAEPLPPPPREPPTNSIGTAGFVVSLVAIPTCGSLSPIGLILGPISLG